MLKAAGSARMILISSVAGGPTALRSGTIYAMTKGECAQAWQHMVHLLRGHLCMCGDTHASACARSCTKAFSTNEGSHVMHVQLCGLIMCLQLP